jgi:hypothetical protein
MFAESKNCGARETAVASKRFCNNNTFLSNGRETDNGKSPDAMQQILNKPKKTVVVGNFCVNTFPLQRIFMQQMNDIIFDISAEIL